MKLSELETKAPNKINKEKAKQQTKAWIKEIIKLQEKLYAQGKYSILVILQGLDASGKDGAIKKVFGKISPNGCKVKSFKKPNKKEYSHDFLWRIHKETPAKGMIQIFNRSHYEDVLVPSIYNIIDKKTINKRYEIINNFEFALSENNTIIIKFFLLTSKEEQRERLQERIDKKEKHWKHSDGDWETRKHWTEFINEYEKIFNICDIIPWQIVPADQNWYKEHIVAKKVYETLSKLPLEWPELKSDKFGR